MRGRCNIVFSDFADDCLQCILYGMCVNLFWSQMVNPVNTLIIINKNIKYFRLKEWNLFLVLFASNFTFVFCFFLKFSLKTKNLIIVNANAISNKIYYFH